jgi:hypothetical protein
MTFFNKMMMFAASLASRGFNNTKTDIETKQLRVLSCFGGLDIDTQCPFLRRSDIDSTKHYCGKCGCGDKKHTWLMANEVEYSKLDYPTLYCPMKMPGFSDYDPNFKPLEIKWRKEKIESIDPDDLKFIQVTIGVDKDKEKVIENINKIIENT